MLFKICHSFKDLLQSYRQQLLRTYLTTSKQNTNHNDTKMTSKWLQNDFKMIVKILFQSVMIHFNVIFAVIVICPARIVISDSRCRIYSWRDHSWSYLVWYSARRPYDRHPISRTKEPRTRGASPGHRPVVVSRLTPDGSRISRLTDWEGQLRVNKKKIA